MKLSEVEEVIGGCGLNILRECKPLPLGDKYIIEAEGPEDEYCRIILCASDVSCENDNHTWMCHRNGMQRKPFDSEHDTFYNAIVTTGDMEDELREILQETDVVQKIEVYKQKHKMGKKCDIVAVGSNTDLFWYKIDIGRAHNTEYGTDLNNASLKEAITCILDFREFIDKLIKENRKSIYEEDGRD